MILTFYVSSLISTIWSLYFVYSLQLAEEYQKDDVRALLRDPPCLMDTPFVTFVERDREYGDRFAKFGVMWKAPISKGADLDGYRLLVSIYSEEAAREWKHC